MRDNIGVQPSPSGAPHGTTEGDGCATDSIVFYTSPSDVPRGMLEREGYASTLLSNPHLQMHRAVQLKATDELLHYTTDVMS